MTGKDQLKQKRTFGGVFCIVLDSRTHFTKQRTGDTCSFPSLATEETHCSPALAGSDEKEESTSQQASKGLQCPRCGPWLCGGNFFPWRRKNGISEKTFWNVTLVPQTLTSRPITSERQTEALSELTQQRQLSTAGKEQNVKEQRGHFNYTSSKC